MESSRRLSSEARNRTEAFLQFVSGLLDSGSNDLGYKKAVEIALCSLADGLGRRRRLGRAPISCSIGAPVSLLDLCGAADLPVLYQRCLSVQPRLRRGLIEWISAKDDRRKRGSYYTPQSHVEPLIQFALDDAGRAPTICDPACGGGSFLIFAAKEIAARLRLPIKSVVARSIFGCDIDPVSVTLTKLMMWLETGATIPKENIVCADAFALDWSRAFQRVFSRGGFDAIVGNPPFGAVVDGRVPDSLKSSRAIRFPELLGTADHSFYFASLARQLINGGGRIGLVLPRAFLSARASVRLRAEATVIESCVEHDIFHGAAVYVCLVGFDATKKPAIKKSLESAPESLSVSASATVAEAYDLAPSIRDEPKGSGLKLLTTGLIDPGRSLWGKATCRYLKTRYRYPRIPGLGLTPRRLSLARRPKLIVAGLSRSIECYLDVRGEYAGSVGTYSITHATNDCEVLRRAMDRLHSEEMTRRFRTELGPSALGGGNITMTKRFLREVLAEEGF